MAEKLADEKLAKLCLKDEKYFNILVDRFTDKIRFYIARLIGNYQESEDLTQEVFIKAYENIASFNPKMKFSAWIYRIAHNQGVNFIKKHYRFRQVEFNEGIKNKFLEDNIALKKILANENIEIIKNNINKLKDRDREILELAYFEEKSYEEIADILEMHINSIGPTIKRSKDKLKKLILETQNEQIIEKNKK